MGRYKRGLISCPFTVLEAALQGPATPFDVIAGYLAPGESILWCGQPRAGVFLTWNDVVSLPFVLAWNIFAIFWEAMAVRGAMSLGLVVAPMLVFGLPFVLIGLYFICGRFFVEARLRARTFYGLTDRRILIVRRPPLASVRMVDLDHLADVSFSEGREGRGTIVFRTPARFYDGEGGQRFASRRRLDWMPEFFAIDEVRRVFTAIQQRMQGR